MGTVTRFEDLEVWQHARRLANLIYELTSKGAEEEGSKGAEEQGERNGLQKF